MHPAPLAVETEQQWLAAARRGDRTAQDRLLSAYLPTMQRFASRMATDPQAVDDAVQEALVAAIRFLPAFRGESALSTWLYRLVHTACNRQRRRGRSVRHADVHLDAGDGAVLADGHALADETTAQHELLQQVETALARLPPEWRAVLHLRDVEGLSASEAAKALGIEVPALKSRLHRARSALREQLVPVSAAPLPRQPPGCPDVVRLFSRYLEGDVTADACARMETHLSGCPVCRDRCESLRRTVALCRRAGDGHIPIATQHLVRSALSRARARILAAEAAEAEPTTASGEV